MPFGVITVSARSKQHETSPVVTQMDDMRTPQIRLMQFLNTFMHHERVNVTITTPDMFAATAVMKQIPPKLTFKLENVTIPNDSTENKSSFTELNYIGLEPEDAEYVSSLILWVLVQDRRNITLSIKMYDGRAGTMSSIKFEPAATEQELSEMRRSALDLEHGELHFPSVKITEHKPSVLVKPTIQLSQGQHIVDKTSLPEKQSAIHIDSILQNVFEPIANGLQDTPSFQGQPVYPRPNVLEHTGGVVLAALYLSSYFNKIGIYNSKEKVVTLAALHDTPEKLYGDIPRDAKYDHGAASEKLREALAMLDEVAERQNFGPLGDPELYDMSAEALREEAAKSSIESLIAKLADIADRIRTIKHSPSLPDGIRAEMLEKNRNVFVARRDALIHKAQTDFEERHKNSELKSDVAVFPVDEKELRRIVSREDQVNSLIKQVSDAMDRENAQKKRADAAEAELAKLRRGKST